MTLNAPESGKTFDISQSYLYFRNKGEVSIDFKLDAVATISYQSGDIKLIGLDNFPGATFRVPGVVTVGPNIAVYASADAVLSVAGHLEADVTVAKWDIQQTYPESQQYPATALEQPDRDGTETVGVPKFDYAITANGEITLHLKPTVTFGIVFDDRWKVPRASVDLVLDGYMTFHAQASLAQGGAACPFSYGINAGSDLYGQVSVPPNFAWGGNHRFPIASVPPRQITPDTCPQQETTGKLLRRFEENAFQHNASAVPIDGLLEGLDSNGLGITWPSQSALLPTLQHSGLIKRDTFTLGPLISIPASFLACPAPDNSLSEACPICISHGSPSDVSKFRRADEVGQACPLVIPVDPEAACTSSSLSKRGKASKTISLSWFPRPFFFSNYPSCSADDPPKEVPKVSRSMFLMQANLGRSWADDTSGSPQPVPSARRAVHLRLKKCPRTPAQPQLQKVD